MTAFTPAMSPSLNRSLTSFPRPLTSLLGEEGLVTLHPRRLVHYASLSIPAMSRRGTEPALQPGQGRRTGGERLVEQRQLVTVHPDGIDRKK